MVRLAEGHYPAGRHDIRWHAAGMPAGLYLYRLQSQGQIIGRRMLRLRD